MVTVNVQQVVHFCMYTGGSLSGIERVNLVRNEWTDLFLFCVRCFVCGVLIAYGFSFRTDFRCECEFFESVGDYPLGWFFE